MEPKIDPNAEDEVHIPQPEERTKSDLETELSMSMGAGYHHLGLDDFKTKLKEATPPELWAMYRPIVANEVFDTGGDERKAGKRELAKAVEDEMKERGIVEK